MKKRKRRKHKDGGRSVLLIKPKKEDVLVKAQQLTIGNSFKKLVNNEVNVILKTQNGLNMRSFVTQEIFENLEPLILRKIKNDIASIPKKRRVIQKKRSLSKPLAKNAGQFAKIIYVGMRNK